MKKFFPLFAFLLFTFEFVKAQAPQATSYQAVIRNSSGNVLSNQLVKVRFSIRDSAANGTVLYQETQTSTTNAQGLINLFAGQGTAVTGSFAGINWGNKSKFLQTEIDIAGGNNYTDMGTAQLMSVPYALYANNGMPTGTTSGEILYWNGTSWVKTNPGSNGQNLTICNGVPQWGPCFILPTILTGSITAKTNITATAGGNVTDSGSRAITERGVCFSTTINPTIANTKTASGTNVIGAFTVSLTGLSALTTYHYRAYATTILGTSYGADSVFTTNGATLPTLTTTVASSINTNTATSGGNITSDGGATITARGICWSTTANPTIALVTKTVDGTGTGTFTSSIAGLTLNTTYYIRAYATNSVGTAYGTQQTFTTASAVVLPSVTIGTQVWTSQNLSVARYRNGDLIPQVTDATQWGALITGAWCWYNNDSATYAATYGRLYNWYAVNDARGLAPYGYHIPTDEEWNKLVKYLDAGSDTTCQGCSQSAIAGGAMKSTSGWNAPNTGATNSSGFAGLPGGCRYNDGTFNSIGYSYDGDWWSSTENNTTFAWYRNLNYYYSTVYRGLATKSFGFSVRCVRDTTIIPITPILSTSTPTNIAPTSATSGGTITSDGGATITARGICWSTTVNPTITLTTKTVDGTGTGAFTSSITGLTANTTYYVRAYATNSAGTAYGTQQTFTTLTNIPTVTTNTISSITTTTATSGGNITSDGGATITARGICWSTTANPTIALTTKTVDGTGIGAFTSSITGLTANTRYYVRAYATNSVGTAYGADSVFTTSGATVATLTTTAASIITGTTATSGGNITSDGGATITVRGVCWSTTANPTIALATKTVDGTGTGAFTSSITGLTANTTYYVRAYATNSAGTAYGTQQTFTTLPTTIPTVTTNTISNITTTTATSVGNITSDGGATITARGICWSTTANPTIALTTKTVDGTGIGTFTSSITGLTTNTTYYVRAYATNSSGTAYGTQQTFTTASAVLLPSVTIGTQVWTTQNLSVARYRNGEIIPQVTDATQWAAFTIGAWCWYNNDSATYAATYGRLYNWYAVNDPRGLAPQGYHIPSNSEWNKMVKYLDAGADTTCVSCNQSSIAGGAMKSTTGWTAPNTGATNSSGFAGLPGGFRTGGGTFYPSGLVGYWWSSTEDNTDNRKALSRSVYHSAGEVYRLSDFKVFGYSVRCLRDTTIIPTTPILTTISATNLTTTTATSGGNITSDGGAIITARGICWSTTANPTIALTTKTVNGTGTGSFTSSITGLTASTTYFVRAYATNSAGTTYGTQQTFTSLTPTIATATTTAISSITTTTATSGGNITSDGGATITARGICWSTTANPTIALTTKTVDGTGTGTFTSSITGLTASTTYYVRAYATNSVATAYGTQQTFTTSSAVVNLPSVTIGTQIWTNQNLSVARYRNGDLIPQVTDNTQWASLTTGAWCWYNNDSATYAATYGRLYNWYAVNDARGLAPQGYHIPTDSEWKKLVKYLDTGADTTCQGCIQSYISGGAMKSTSGWNAPNTGATNSSGFAGLPGGMRISDGTFDFIGTNGFWQSSTEYLTSFAWQRFLNYDNSSVNSFFNTKSLGFSVRCVRD